MPRAKPSLERVRFQTPHIEEFQRYIWVELVNAMQWNRKNIIQTTVGPNRWTFAGNWKDGASWTISFDGKQVVVESKERRVHLRQGLHIDMTNARVVVGGQA